MAGAVIAATPSLQASSYPAANGAVAHATATPPRGPGGPGASPAGSNAATGHAGQSPSSSGRGAPVGPLEPSLLRGYVWPLPKGRITNEFGPDWYSDTIVKGARFHDGLDMATFCGDRIVAAHDGVVLAAGRKVDPWMGWIGSLAPSIARRDRLHAWADLPIIIVVDDGNGYRSIYAHFSRIAVKAGQTVRAGMFIGWEGQTGFATGCHLHYGLFSPYATTWFGLRPDVVKRTKLPALEIARIDPLLVLPHRSMAAAPGSSPSPGPSPASGSRADPLVASSDQRPGGQPPE